MQTTEAFSADQTEAHPFAYITYTVNNWRLVGERVVWGNSAQDIAEALVRAGYVKAEVAPAAPVNGFPNNVAGVDYVSGDTFSIDTRKRVIA